MHLKELEKLIERSARRQKKNEAKKKIEEREGSYTMCSGWRELKGCQLVSLSDAFGLRQICSYAGPVEHCSMPV